MQTTKKILLFCAVFFVCFILASKLSVSAAECAPGECDGWDRGCNPDPWPDGPNTYCCNGGGCPSAVCNNEPGCSWIRRACRQNGTNCAPKTREQCNASSACVWVGGATGCGPRSCDGVVGEDDACAACGGGGGGGGGGECTETPDAAVLTSPLSPANGVIINYETITYDWNEISDWGNDCDDADYRVFVYSDVGLANVVVDSGLLGSGVTQFTKTGTDSGNFIDGQTYWWRVRTSNEVNEAWSNTWTFTYDVTLPPTCTVTGPSTILRGTQGTWSISASDPEGTVNRIDAYRRKFDPVGSNFSWGSWIAGELWSYMGQQNPSCGSSSCSFNNITWTPDSTALGRHWVTGLVWDDTQDDQCAGNPEFIDLPPGSTIAGFRDCGNSCRMQVSVTCGVAPSQPTLTAPPNDASNVSINPSVTLGWNSVSNWGDTCVSSNNTYTVYARVKSGQWCPSASPVTYGTDTSCTGLSSATTQCSAWLNAPGTRYCWYVEANNGEFSTNSVVWQYTTENPVVNQNWVTSVGAEVYAGGVIMELPEFDVNTLQFGDFQYPYLAYRSASFPATVVPVPYYIDSDANITAVGYSYDPESQPASQPGNGLFAEYTAFANAWPEAYENLSAPSGAIDIDNAYNCDELFDTAENIKAADVEVYKASASCMEDAFAGNDTYKVNGTGAAVIYVYDDGSGPLTISDNVFAQNNDYLILVVLDGLDIEIERNVGLSTDPELTSLPQISLSIVSTGDIKFIGAQDEGADPETDPDSTIVVQGPIMTSRQIAFNRNRGAGNGYPAEMVKYQPKYIYELTSQERSADEYNISGLFVTDIVYLEDE